MYDYQGNMDYFQKQLEKAGISKEEFDISNYVGLTAKELQGIVDWKIGQKKKEREN